MPNRPQHPEQRQASAEAELAILNIAAYRFVAIHDREKNNFANSGLNNALPLA